MRADIFGAIFRGIRGVPFSKSCKYTVFFELPLYTVIKYYRRSERRCVPTFPEAILRSERVNTIIIIK